MPRDFYQGQFLPGRYPHIRHSLNSLKGGYIGDYIGDYHRGY